MDVRRVAVVVAGLLLSSLAAPPSAAHAAAPDPDGLTVATWNTDLVPWAADPASVVDTVATADVDVLGLQGVWTPAARQAILDDPRVAARFPYSYAPAPEQALGQCDDTVTPSAFQEAWINLMVQTGYRWGELAHSAPPEHEVVFAGLQVLLTSPVCYSVLTRLLQQFPPAYNPIDAIEQGGWPTALQYLFDGDSGQLVLSSVPLTGTGVHFYDTWAFHRSTVSVTAGGLRLQFASWPRNYLADIDPELGPYQYGALQPEPAADVVATAPDLLLGGVNSGTGYQPQASADLVSAGYARLFDQPTYCPAATHAGSVSCASSFELITDYPDPLPLDNAFAKRDARCEPAGTFATGAESSHLGLAVRCTPFPATPVLDTFDRRDGSALSGWAGATGKAFYRVAGMKLDVVLGGPLVWKQAFGRAQEAYATLSSIDPRGAAQGLLLKVQALTSESAGALSVSYDPRAGAVRVSALRLAQGSWTSYPAVPGAFAAGDRLGARAKADGSVEVYRNGALLGTVVLSAADTGFFAPRGGRIGLWTVAAGKAVLDDFGGGSLATP